MGWYLFINSHLLSLQILPPPPFSPLSFWISNYLLSRLLHCVLCLPSLFHFSSVSAIRLFLLPYFLIHWFFFFSSAISNSLLNLSTFLISFFSSRIIALVPFQFFTSRFILSSSLMKISSSTFFPFCCFPDCLMVLVLSTCGPVSVACSWSLFSLVLHYIWNCPSHPYGEIIWGLGQYLSLERIFILPGAWTH